MAKALVINGVLYRAQEDREKRRKKIVFNCYKETYRLLIFFILAAA